MSVQVNIVIPMAGKGARFSEAGYTTPKPFIAFDGCMMIEHVIKGLPWKNNNIILVVHESFKSSYKPALQHLVDTYSVKLCSVKATTAGAACTGLAARYVIDHKKPVLFMDSDNIFQSTHLSQFIDDAQKRQLDGSLITFPSKSNKFSYAETNFEGMVLRLKEKQVISSRAVAGAYYFSSYEIFQKYAIEMMIYGDVSKNEYYMSTVYNYLIEDKGVVGVWDIGESDFLCVGTPKQLDAHLERKL